MKQSELLPEKDLLLLRDKQSNIDNFFVEDGWVTVYQWNDSENTESFVYSCIIHSAYLDKYRETHEWGIRPGQEGKPAVFSTYEGEKEKTTYQTYSDEGIEPFIFSKSFNFDGGKERYIDISEEFVLYYKLYERLESKQNRTYYYIDDSGELDPAIIVKPKHVKVKLRYIKEYLAVRDCYLAVCFEYMRFSTSSLFELDLVKGDTHIRETNKIYNIYMEPFLFRDSFKCRNWTLGKVIINPDFKYLEHLHFEGDRNYETFIVGYDDNGEEVHLDCSKTTEKYFVMTYFRKDVLEKYYNDPNRYQITAMSLQSDFFYLKMDNNHNDYVAVFLVELRMLPTKEQRHWKQYNYLPVERGMSSSYYRTMIEGNWTEHPETYDLFFKHRLDEVNGKWEKKFGWKLYKPLSSQDSYRIEGLHIPTTNNVKSFCDQILSLVIIMIDSLNEAEFKRYIEVAQNDKGITKFEKFLTSQGVTIPEMIEFHRHLQNLRSGLAAHRFSNSNDKAEKAIAYFEIRDDNYIEAAKQIFIKSIHTLNSLNTYLLS